MLMSNINLSGEATEFLLYSYFGCDSKELAHGGKEKCAYRAYLDLARTVKYTYSSTELEKAKSGSDAYAFAVVQKDRIRDICLKLIESIEGYPIDSSDFDSWHERECHQIIKNMNASYDKEKRKFLKVNFTYGQAQKWLNMTLKYLWLLDMLPVGISPEYLHVPIDSFILQALKETGEFSAKDNKITGSGDSYYYNGEAWSAISTSKNYEQLQNSIKALAAKNGLSPIEWEGPAWIDVAKKRSNK